MKALLHASALIIAVSFFIPAQGVAIALPQTTWHIDDDNISGPWDGSKANPFQHIQDGIDAASGGDSVLVMPGTYTENIDFLGKAITVRSGEGPDVTTIDGNRTWCVVMFASGEGAASVIEGFRICNGWDGGPPYDNGGGITCRNSSSPTITGNIISGNSARNGGGMCCRASSPTVSGNSFEGNEGSYGGGIFCNSSAPKILNNVFWGNSASSSGGGIECNFSPPEIKYNFFSENSAAHEGGGICCNYSSPEVSDNAFDKNSADSGGGLSCTRDSSLKVMNKRFAPHCPL